MNKVQVKSKNFTCAEKAFFVEILKKYGNTIESKKSNAATLAEKEEAWGLIAAEYNGSTIVSEQRSILQLKKLWTNLKTQQRNALTQERQHVLGTGGGPRIVSVEINPNISAIAPHLDALASSVFTSNLSDNEMIVNEDKVDIHMEPGKKDCETRHLPQTNRETTTAVVQEDGELTPGPSVSWGEHEPLQLQAQDETRQSRKRKSSSSEERTRLRTQRLLEQDAALFQLKLEQQKELGALTLEHTRKKFKLDLRAATAQAELAELLLKKELDKVKK